jgi:hypothetical protein
MHGPAGEPQTNVAKNGRCVGIQKCSVNSSLGVGIYGRLLEISNGK